MSTTEAPTAPKLDENGIESPLSRLSEEQIEAIGREFDAIHDEVFNDLGERDARYIRSIIDLHRRLALMGRAILIGSRFRPAWIGGTATLSMAKILENMEIGHNVLHGQWDWMNDPQIHSSAWDWDTASTAEAWKHSHNYVHHTFTNIRGKDKDLGYEIMRIDPHQKWHPVYLMQPIYNALLTLLFEWGVAVHDLDFEAIRSGEKSMKQVRRELRGIAGKAWTQIRKDYIAFPALSGGIAAGIAAAVAARDGGPRRFRGRRFGRRKRARDVALQAWGDEFVRTFKSTAKANAISNVVRNVWAHAIIFCGHFPDQTYTFSQEEVEGETKGGWYVRQLVGAANIEGSALFHVISGNLGYQVEHHLFPDMPSTRYAEIAPKVKDVCKRYGLPYNSGPFAQQWWMVHRTIARLALPGGEPRPKPGPYRGKDGEPIRENGHRADATNGRPDSGAPAPTENAPADGPATNAN
jgi:NADPH-dependent stearoyl-CoA 9-desaturase